MSENLSKNERFFCEDFRFFPFFSGFLRIFPDFFRFSADFNFLSQFFIKKDKFFIFIFCKKTYFFLLFLGFSAKSSTKEIVPIFENSQGQCPRKDSRIFPVLSGF